ncbi:MAG TPA: hypothetical protein VIH57_07180 [Bacteroidales bacterium]|jgi:hypothetical protein
MQVIENAVVISRSQGEHNVVIVEDVNSGVEISLQNPKGIEVELGLEGKVIYKAETVNQLLSFEPVLIEELA